MIEEINMSDSINPQTSCLTICIWHTY